MITDPKHPFLEDKTVWVAVLSDNTTVYADDYYDELEPVSAWLRLKDYLAKNKLSIIKFGLRFRDNYKWLPENCDGYYFANGAVAMLFSNQTIEYKVIGYIENDQLICRSYSVPALLLGQVTIRDITDSISLWRK